MAAEHLPIQTRINPVTVIDDYSRWLTEHWGQVAFALGIGVAIYLVLNFVRGFIKTLCQREHVSGLLSVAGRAAQRTSHIFMMVVAIRIVAGYLNLPLVLATMLQFLFVVITVVQVALWVRAIIIGLAELRSGQEGSETLANAMGIIRVLVSVTVFAIATIVILDNLGVNVTGLIAGLGIGGIAIGLAAQGIFSDLFASLSIIFDKPFKVGDTINFGSMTATVERIGLKSTRMRAVTGEKLVVSNAQLLSKEITSYVQLDHRRIKFTFGMIYQTTPEAADGVPAVMQGIVEAHGGQFVRCGFIGFGASSLDFEMEFDVYSFDWDEIFGIRHRIGLAILRHFNEHGLEFAYPTQTTFTAAPDGRMIMPYPAREPARSKASSGASKAQRTSE